MTMTTDAATLEEQILEELAEADHAPEAGDLKQRDVIHAADDDLPVSVVNHALTSAGYAYIYNARTGDRSLTSRNMLPAQLKKLDEDGRRVFTTRKPKQAAAHGGRYRCRLHPERRTAEDDAMGLPTCPKANLASEFQVTRHMQTRHHVEWATISDREQRAREADERTWQRQLLEMAANGRVPAPAKDTAGMAARRRAREAEAARQAQALAGKGA